MNYGHRMGYLYMFVMQKALFAHIVGSDKGWSFGNYDIANL